jgi:hypothetical protein
MAKYSPVAYGDQEFIEFFPAGASGSPPDS